jgi:hypothetical protein
MKYVVVAEDERGNLVYWAKCRRWHPVDLRVI